MDSVLHGLLFASMYLDDILVYSPNVESHKDHLHQVFLHLQKAELTCVEGSVVLVSIMCVTWVTSFQQVEFNQTPTK